MFLLALSVLLLCFSIFPPGLSSLVLVGSWTIERRWEPVGVVRAVVVIREAHNVLGGASNVGFPELLMGGGYVT